MKKSRTLVIAVPLMIILSGLVIYQYGVIRVRTGLSSVREEQDVKMRLLTKYISLISEKPFLEKKLADMKEERKADGSKLIEGQTPSLAAATLQETIKGIVTGRGGTISSERVGKPEERGKFTVISVSIDAVLPDTGALSDILYSIETRTPYLVVKELDARIRNLKDPKDLVVKLDITAMTGAK
ncbi:MAG: hypothetical protein HZA17_00755 [Nitrospirae bacterium]|nr:hypothetical protein [Nitrospirota bacterium]